MTTHGTRVVGSFALGASLLSFLVYFMNVLIAGPLAKSPFMSDVGEMLTLLLAVVLFVVGSVAREAQETARNSEQRLKEANTSQAG